LVGDDKIHAEQHAAAHLDVAGALLDLDGPADIGWTTGAACGGREATEHLRQRDSTANLAATNGGAASSGRPLDSAAQHLAALDYNVPAAAHGEDRNHTLQDHSGGVNGSERVDHGFRPHLDLLALRYSRAARYLQGACEEQGAAVGGLHHPVYTHRAHSREAGAGIDNNRPSHGDAV